MLLLSIVSQKRLSDFSAVKCCPSVFKAYLSTSRNLTVGFWVEILSPSVDGHVTEWVWPMEFANL